MANEALYYGTGRRKNAVARVRLVPGTGKVTVNGRDGKEYFGREALLDYAKTPFKVTDTQDHFDVLARIDGGGISGQAGALRHGISRALLAAGDYRAELKKAGFLTRDARMVERKKYGLKKARSSASAKVCFFWPRQAWPCKPGKPVPRKRGGLSALLGRKSGRCVRLFRNETFHVLKTAGNIAPVP